MTARIRRRFASTLRLAAILLFALSILVRPAVESLEAVDGYAHYGTGQGAPPVQAAVSSVVGDIPDGDTPESALHELFNFSHCCSSALAITPEAMLGPLPGWGTDVPQPAGATPPAMHRRVRPFRPPIAA